MMQYQPDWGSLTTHKTPDWFKEAKFGIYTHWGVYSVPAFGPNATVYPYYMYRKDSRQHEHHIKTYGPPEKFGYKDFIPMFTGDKFDPQEWAEQFRNAGAKFAGPVAEHCDGFAMWDSQLTELKRLYPGEIMSIKMLGIDQELSWSLTPAGLTVNPPDQKPCEHAFVLKIDRDASFDF